MPQSVVDGMFPSFLKLLSEDQYSSGMGGEVWYLRGYYKPRAGIF